MGKALWKQAEVELGNIATPPFVLGDSATRFRLTSFGKPRGPWRETAAAAMRDAVDAGLASWDEEKNEHFIAFPVDIQRADVSGLDSGDPAVVVGSAVHEDE